MFAAPTLSSLNITSRWCYSLPDLQLCDAEQQKNSPCNMREVV